MSKVILVIILVVILAFTIGSYYFIAHFSNPKMALTQTPTPMVPQTQNKNCQSNQLSAIIFAQGAAGNIYGTLTLTNIGKTSCKIALGNTITAAFDAKNIEINYKQNVPSQTFMLAPSQKVYSQIHYPNGPQCQSEIVPVPVSFYYKTANTSVMFESNQQTGKLMVQSCKSESEKTTIDIWPLSQAPVNP